MTEWACPTCRGSLSSSFVCADCGATFPMLGTVPVLLSDAEASLQRWRVRAREFALGVSRGIRAAETELKRPDLLPSTQKRIARACTALADNRVRLLSLLDEVGIRPAPTEEEELETDEVMSAAGRAGITEYYDQLHRDWGWPDDDSENTDAAEQALGAFGDAKPGVLLVLGAGAGRLAYDVHRALSPRKTIALDINPLLCVACARIAGGGTVSLFEFPLIPRNIDTTHVLRDLRAPQAAGDGFITVLADAFAPPLADGTVDAVLTPWFIDQVPADARDAIGVVHRLLKPGGRWVNFGPLVYPKDRAFGVRYTQSELLELVGVSGFKVGSARTSMMDFLCSPAAGYSRTEQVLTFAADKQKNADPDQWLLAPHLPIPRFAGLDDYKPTHPLLGHVAAMIDGKTSLEVITQRVIREHGIPTAVAKLGVPAAAAEIAKQLR